MTGKPTKARPLRVPTLKDKPQTPRPVQAPIQTLDLMEMPPSPKLSPLGPTPWGCLHKY
jgi:hypothetical protein